MHTFTVHENASSVVMTMTELREHPRFSVRVPFLCQSLDTGAAQLYGFTENVSHGGVLVQVSRSLPRSSQVTLLLLLGELVVRARGMIAWNNDEPAGRMGVWLDVENLGDRDEWERFLAWQAGALSRASVRLSIDQQATCVTASYSCLPSRIESLSAGGLKVSGPEAVPVGTFLTVWVPPLGTLPPVSTEAVVRWAKPAGERQAGVVHGLQLVGVEMEAQHFVSCVLLRHLPIHLQFPPEFSPPLFYLLAMTARENPDSTPLHE